MTSAYFDCYNGISGDMTLGALIDLGLPVEDLRQALSSLPVSGYSIEVERVKRCGIGATLAKVTCEEQQKHRHFSHIREMIEASDLSPAVKERSVAAFHAIAVAEAKVHEITVERVHFHEVGAVDAIVDIVGSMWGVEALGITSVSASPVVVGSGTVKCAHGIMPVPAPATALLLAGKPIETGPLPGESTTPTGAAILTTLTDKFGPLRNFAPGRVGYGAGSRVTEGHTNYLRILLGETPLDDSLPVETRELVVLATEIDDMSGEAFGYLMEKLFAMGCLDANFRPVQMKKNRPGTAIQVLTSPDKANGLIALLLRETSTFGVRATPCQRHALLRKSEMVDTPFGKVRVKLGLWGDEVIKVSPEFDDCRQLAEESGVALETIYAAARQSASTIKLN